MQSIGLAVPTPVVMNEIGQSLHCVSPDWSWYVPTAQRTHCVPSSLATVPGSHGAHAVFPGPSATSPLAHPLHAPLPTSALNVPGSHNTHLVLPSSSATPSEYSPGRQNVQPV